MEYFYFHNFIYETVWKDNRRRQNERVYTEDIIHKYSGDYKIIFVGDATMAPYEITNPGGSIEHWNDEPGHVWIKRLSDHFANLAWLNPVPDDHWDYTSSVCILRDLFDNRMYPLTLKGLEEGMSELSDYIYQNDNDKIAIYNQLITLPKDTGNYNLKLFKENIDFKFGRPKHSSKNSISFGYSGELENYKIVFEAYFLKSFSSRLAEYSNPEIEVNSKNIINANYTIVSSTLVATDSRPEVKIEWRVYTKDPDNLLIRDLIIEGLSLARTQKEEFSSIINSNDGKIEALLKNLSDFSAK